MKTIFLYDIESKYLLKTFENVLEYNEQIIKYKAGKAIATHALQLGQIISEELYEEDKY